MAPKSDKALVKSTERIMYLNLLGCRNSRRQCNLSYLYNNNYYYYYLHAGTLWV